MSSSQHGGSRANSGRKPINAEPMVTRAFVIRQDQESWIKHVADSEGVNRSEALRRILDDAHEALT